MRLAGKARSNRRKTTERDADDHAAPKQAAPKSLDKATDSADRLAYLCEQYHATYSRESVEGGGVRVILHVTGEGATTDEAIAKLIDQLGA